ncbi:MAG: extracellular solute-binding protein [Clostridia bacterium]|nr:extracellular solute-binding protein [Clostridia bacterium]
MRKQVVKRSLALGACAVMAFSGVGCKEKVANDENTLEMFICDFGYGTEWLEAQAEEFKKTDWVTAKYPELKVSVDSLADQAMANSKIMAGEQGNTADLLFTASESGYIYYESGMYLDLTSVYDSVIPNEDVKVKDKMNEIKYTDRLYTTDNGEEKIYSFPWVNGFAGLFINLTAKNEILGADYVMPRTSNELAKMCEDIKASATNSKDAYPFISSSTYYRTLFTIWWAQYEGLDEYANYFNGIADGELSNKIFEQKGRLRALEELERIMGYDSQNVNPLSQELDFMSLQAHFFNGTAVMMTNGDWLETEMSELIKGEITVMKNPVISTITEKLSVVKSEEELAFVVQCVDENKDVTATQAAFNERFQKELTPSDYEKIYNARNLLNSWNVHEAYIPSYSTAKELAKDFLLFMASDKGIEIFMRETSGCQTAFTYDAETKNPELFNSFTTLQKDHVKMGRTAIPLHDMAQTRLVAYGGLKNLTAVNLQANFLSSNAAARKSANAVYQEDIEYYKEENGRFDIMLRQAGLKG